MNNSSPAAEGQQKPRLKAPAASCDCHMHVFGPAARYAFAPNLDYEPDDATVDTYLAMRRRIGIERTVVVQPSVYGTDNSCTLDSIAAIGPGARGIAVVGPDVSEAEIQRLHAGGIRGLRFSLVVKNALRPEHMQAMAARIKDLGWHFQLRSTEADLCQLEPILLALPVDVCIDHMSSIKPDSGIGHPAFTSLLRLVDTGRCWVKLSGPYQLSRTGAPAYADMAPQARALARAAPERMVWGTNWPHPLVTDMPDDGHLLDVLLDWTDSDSVRHAILVDNPAALYDFG
jgi:predicted TIM-barrel fold metal-dependent hydrolase